MPDGSKRATAMRMRRGGGTLPTKTIVLRRRPERWRPRGPRCRGSGLRRNTNERSRRIGQHLRQQPEIALAGARLAPYERDVPRGILRIERPRGHLGMVENA